MIAQKTDPREGRAATSLVLVDDVDATAIRVGESEFEPQLPSPRFSSVDGGRDSNRDSTRLTEISQHTVPQEITRFVPLRRSPVRPRSFRVLQQWEGVVTSVNSDSFEAELRDLTDPSAPVEFVELPLSEVSEPDKPLLTPGSIFYWILGHETRNKQILNVSEIRLRRFPPISAATVEAATEKGRALYELFNSNAQPSFDPASSPGSG